MNTKIFHSYGNQEIDEYDFDLGAMRSDQMLIRTKYTGICRSDVDQYTGKIEIPYGCFGHESVGEVVAVGSDITEFRVGDYVASRDDLAYSPYFYATETNTAKIPELHPRYITEPVACSVNIAHQMLQQFLHPIEKVLIVGSGFVANLTAQYLRYKHPDIEIHVIGNHNVTEWNLIDAKFVTVDNGSNTFVPFTLKSLMLLIWVAFDRSSRIKNTKPDPPTPCWAVFARFPKLGAG